MESGHVHRQKAHEFIFRSKLPDIEIPDHLPLHTYCFQNISKFKDRPCLINSSTGESHTYADVELATRRFAAALHNLGIGHGDVVMLLLHNCPEFAFAFLGASRLGAITTAANPLYTPAELARQARASGAKLVITQSAYAEKVREFVQENTYVKVACVDAPPEGWCNMQSLSELLPADEAETPRVDIRPDDVVALPYSSGTTGLPKGVMLTHKQLVTSVGQLVDGENPNLYFHSEDVILCVLPLFHIYALNTIFLSSIRVGAAILIMQRFEIGKLFELVEKYKVTVTPFVPPILLSIVKCPDLRRHDLSSIRMIITGGAPMGKELEEAVKDKLPRPELGQGYGMTEGGSVSMCLGFAKESFPAKSGACGTVVRNAEVKIIDPNTGVSLPRNQAGEICIRGNQIMKGFLNDPKATKETIDEGGWLHTGDIGYVDDDNEVFIVDRLKELIKYKGFQVAPAELEALLISHPCISDAAVVPMKDEVAGEVPVAFVVRSSGSYVTEEDIKQYISEQVVFYKRIRQVFFIEKITKSPSGKILRKDLRNGLTTGPA